jgi:hypothetical protein
MMHRLRKNNAITYEELEEWKERHRRQRDCVPGYEGAFGRPSRTAAKRLCRLLRECGEELSVVYADTRLRLTTDERRVWNESAEAALVIGMYTFLQGGAGKHRITFTKFVDALAEKFSDHHARAHTIAPSLSFMRVKTVKDVGRDLLLAGVSVSRIWKALIRYGKNPAFPLYRLSVVATGGEKAYYVTPCTGSRVYERFLRWIIEDKSFAGRTTRRHLLRLVKGSPSSSDRRHPVAYDVCSEWKYNIVELTERSEKLLQIQEAVRLVFDVKTFKRDFVERQRQAATVRRLIQKKYGIDPAQFSNAPRKHTFRGKHIRRRRTTWSERDEEVFFRAIETALKFPYSLLKLRPAFMTHGVTARRRVSFARTTIKRFQAWLTRKKRRIDARLLPTNQKEKLAAGQRAADWGDRVAVDLNEYDKHVLFQKTFARIYEQVRTINSKLLVTCRFGRMMNRRFKALDFWPTYVSSKGPTGQLPELAGTIDQKVLPERSMEAYRTRWFKAFDPNSNNAIALAGRDISSSQMQILALFAGDRGLEASTTDAKRSFKESLAKKAWEWNRTLTEPLFRSMAGIKPYYAQSETGKPDQRLEELVKELIMRVSYGSDPKTVEIDQRKDPGRFGPAWINDGAQRFWELLCKEHPVIGNYLELCQRLATSVERHQRYVGFKVTDPSDGAAVCWNPIKINKMKIKVDDGHALIWVPAEGPDARKRYPVHTPALKTKIAPCLIQLLDAYYSALVMTKLRKFGVKTFVGIHDCWLVPQDKLDVLNKAMKDAAHDWYRGLNSIYNDLAPYCRFDRRLRDFLGHARRVWKQRIRSGQLPAFRSKEVHA